MKAFLYKAKLLIIIYSTSAFLLTLASAAVIKQYYVTEKELPCLSDHYMVGVIRSLDIEAENNLKNKDVIAYLNSIKEKENYIYIRKISNTQGRAVIYSEKTDFALPIISGRLFQKEDFIKHTNTIIISSELEKDCIEKDGKNYYMHNNQYFEVIGVYPGIIGNDIQETLYYVNLNAKYLQDDYAYGEYILDTGKNSQYICNGMQEYFFKLNDYIMMQSKFGLSKDSKQLSNVVSNAAKMIAIVFMSGLLVLMNSLSVSIQWIGGRKKEIAIRKLLGASDEKIRIWLIKQYITLICCSFFIGTLLATFLIKNSKNIIAAPTIYLLFGDTLNLITTVIAFIILLIEGLAVLFWTLNSYNKKQIVSNVR